MSLDPHPTHPSSRSYVLKLHRDARPHQGRLFGRHESHGSGRCCAVARADEQHRCLVHDAPATLRDASDLDSERD